MDKNNDDGTTVKSGFSTRPLVKLKESTVVPVENTVGDTASSKDEICVLEEFENTVREPETLSYEDNKNILFAIIFVLLLIIALLGYNLYCARCANNLDQQEETEVVIDSKYEELQNVVKDYLAKMKDPNKTELASQISSVYVEASTAKGDINNIETDIRKKSQDILGFNEPGYSSKTDYEYEWQELFGSSGVINSWLEKSNFIITKDNQKDVFMAIARGLK